MNIDVHLFICCPKARVFMFELTPTHRYNAIRALTVAQLQQVDKLTVLLLTGNPLQSVWEGASLPAHTYFPALQTLELSMASSSHLQASDFSPFSDLTTLRLSCDHGLHVLGSLHTPQLRHLDLRGCRVKDFTPGLMRNLSQLHDAHVDSYKLCCPQALPEGNDMLNDYVCFLCVPLLCIPVNGFR